MHTEISGIHAELGLKQGTIRQESYNVVKVHVGEMVCTLQLPNQQYESLKEQGIDPFELLNTLVDRIGKRID
ncbi:MAG: hypothetical protein ABIG70_08500 [Pseudomonadota bacterium]|nr:hypothetical protein [Gammaproteobacteria bacterium]MBU1731892.1 hypothetical protein [Gammaproteobacteria bacterium]MBU1891406.1 hypothetical protein [Gammaproteobacteria bacterium]